MVSRGEQGNEGMWEGPLLIAWGNQGNEGMWEGPLWFPGGSREMRVCGRGHSGSLGE